jgi:AAA15 family ATPase/GTPase
MLIKFRVENFRSIRDEQEFSLVSSNLEGPTVGLLQSTPTPFPLLPVAAIYGANASGKSNVLWALKFIEEAVLLSQRSWAPNERIPLEPFRLDKNAQERPSLFEVEFVAEKVRYAYGFVLNSQEILEEWLYSYPSGRQQTLFVRDAALNRPFRFNRVLKGENQAIAKLTRKNSLFLSTAIQNNHHALKPVYDWFLSGIHFIMDDDRRRHLLHHTVRGFDKPEMRAAILALLKGADLGVCDVAVSSEVLPELARELLEVLAKDDQQMRDFIQKHPTIPRIALKHSIGSGAESLELPLEHESRGTQALLALSGSVLRALNDGTTLCIDELEASLHPVIGIQIVSLFSSAETNPNGAQLIFNTHDINLLDADVLRRDQVWFTEKAKDGATTLYPLTDFKPRKEENLKRGYIQGRYGAIPFAGIGANLRNLVPHE